MDCYGYSHVLVPCFRVVEGLKVYPGLTYLGSRLIWIIMLVTLINLIL